jgi:hypothetical protein
VKFAEWQNIYIIFSWRGIEIGLRAIWCWGEKCGIRESTVGSHTLAITVNAFP